MGGDSSDVQVVEIDQLEGWQMLEDAARTRMGISAQEFLKRWEADDFTEAQRPSVSWVSAFLSLAGHRTPISH